MTAQPVFSLEAAQIPAPVSCVALDLDGTLLNSQGTLSAYTREILNRAVACGVVLVVSSGRPFSALPQEIVTYPGIEYAIASNGVSVHHLPTNRCLHRTVMAEASAERIRSLCPADSFVLEAHIRGVSHAHAEYVRDPAAFGLSPRGVAYIQSTRKPVDDMPAFLREHRGELDGVRIIARTPSVIPLLEAELRSDPAIYLTHEEGGSVMELCHRDCGKHNGLSWLLDSLQLPREGCVAFGNAENDADMLRFAAIGIAVRNASPSCLEAADFLTDSNDEDGVARAMAHLLSL